MCKILRCISKDASIALITLYNTILATIDFLVLLLSFILLTDGNRNLGDIAAVFLLVFGVIALPCICCGICYVWSLFHIQTNLKMARFLGVCNFIMMIFTFIVIATNLKKEEELENPSFVAFFMILNILSIVSTIFLCTINCGFEDETKKEQTRIAEVLHQQPEMLHHDVIETGIISDVEEQLHYPIRFQNNTSIRHAINYPIENYVYPTPTNEIIYNAEPIIPTAPSLSQIEGHPTLH